MASFDEKVAAIIASLSSPESSTDSYLVELQKQQYHTAIQEKKQAIKRQRLAEQAKQERLTKKQVEFSKQQAQIAKEQAEKAEYERIQRPIRARQKFFAQINQMQAEFRFEHPHECKRCPERFSSNSQLHRHVSAQHTKKSVENPSTSRSASPAPPATPTRHSAPSAPPSPPSTPKLVPSPHPLPVPAPTVPEKPSPAAQTVENTPPQTPLREIPSPAPKLPTKTAKLHETFPRIYLPPQKRAYMTIAQLFTKFGSSWPNSACSKPGRPIRKLNPTAPIWNPSNASKSSQSDASKSNCASASTNSTFSMFSTIPASLPPKPPRQQLSARPHWQVPPPSPGIASSTSRKSMGNLHRVIETLLQTVVHLLGQLTCSGTVQAY